MHFLMASAQEKIIPTMTISESLEHKEEAILFVIDHFFEAMKNGDSATVHSFFHPAVRLMSTFTKDGNPVLVEKQISEFLLELGTPHEKVWDERIDEINIQIDENLASVWMDYVFYYGEKLHHCGIIHFNYFILKKDGKSFK